jgi:hypothetical protein
LRNRSGNYARRFCDPPPRENPESTGWLSERPGPAIACDILKEQPKVESPAGIERWSRAGFD